MSSTSPGPTSVVPPAGLAGDRMRLGGILIAGQRVADQDRVAALRVERAVGLIGDRERAEIDAAIEAQRRRDRERVPGPVLVRGAVCGVRSRSTRERSEIRSAAAGALGPPLTRSAMPDGRR